VHQSWMSGAEQPYTICFCTQQHHVLCFYCAAAVLVLRSACLPHALMLLERRPVVVMFEGHGILGGESGPVYVPPGQ
jgi:hypothetical protein